MVVSDTGIPSAKHPALTYALRGIAAFELIVRGPDRDLHSGIFGGSVQNPATALAQLLARVHDANGRITIPGFYQDVISLSAYERKELARLPFNRAAYRKFLGVPDLRLLDRLHARDLDPGVGGLQAGSGVQGLAVAFRTEQSEIKRRFFIGQ